MIKGGFPKEILEIVTEEKRQVFITEHFLCGSANKSLV
jgi:hypothetical protein